MPLQPNAGESESAWMSRCMGHHSDKPQDQAVAICLRIWREGKAMTVADYKAQASSIKSVRQAYTAHEIMGSCITDWFGIKAGAFPTKRDADGKRIILSTSDLDRDGERILVPAWRNETGQKIPLLYGHDNFSMAHALGTITLEKEDVRLLGTLNLAENEAGKNAQALLATGFEQFSAGFLPYLWSDDMGKNLVEREDGDQFPWPRKGRTFYDVVAVEGSLVPVPSNPRAVGLSTDDLKKMLDEYFAARKQIEEPQMPAWWQELTRA
jgi:Caudovirus prohead serine protease